MKTLQVSRATSPRQMGPHLPPVPDERLPPPRPEPAGPPAQPALPGGSFRPARAATLTGSQRPQAAAAAPAPTTLSESPLRALARLPAVPGRGEFAHDFSALRTHAAGRADS